MEKKFEKGSENWQFFQDYYRFRQKYFEADNDTEFFEEMVLAATELRKKYENMEISEYVNQMVIAHMDDVDRRYRVKIGKT